MSASIIKRLSAGLVGLAGPCLGAVVFSGDPALNSPDFLVYQESPPGQLAVNNAHPLASALQGAAGAAGGNIELFASSENPAYLPPAGAFANAPRTTLSGTVSGYAYYFSSLNGQDWFRDGSNAYNTAYGASNLANQWYNGFHAKFMNFLTPVGQGLFGGAAAKQTLFENLRDSGAFAHLSDPNIGYLYHDDSTMEVVFGTEGFIDLSPTLRTQINALYPGQGLGGYILDGMQASEVVKFNDSYYYSFNATPSGVVLNDGQNSYSGNFGFAVPVPEPGPALMALLPGLLVLLRRRTRGLPSRKS